MTDGEDVRMTPAHLLAWLSRADATEQEKLDFLADLMKTRAEVHREAAGAIRAAELNNSSKTNALIDKMCAEHRKAMDKQEMEHSDIIMLIDQEHQRELRESRKSERELRCQIERLKRRKAKPKGKPRRHAEPIEAVLL